MKKIKIEAADVLALIITTTYTWLIYVTGTPSGTEAQADFVRYYTVFVLALALFMLGVSDETIIKVGRRHHMVRAIRDVNLIVQIVLLMVTGHFWLTAMRALSVFIPYARRQSIIYGKTTDTSGTP